ncbi:MAG: hypothetical protein HQ503_04340, partial [Rhodospirillales bacterium]|nr:hypothetical protein [Rhodospirillales bacterium]
MTVTSENVTDARPSKFLKVARSVLAVTLTVGSLAWSADVYRGILLLPIFNEQFYATMMGLSLALVYVQYPLKRGETRTHVPWYDVILGAAGLVAGLYVGWLYEDLTIRLSDIPADALIVSTLFFVLS